MKTTIAVALAFITTAVTIAEARNASFGGSYGTGSNPSSHYVRPSTSSAGKTVEGHDRTNPNATQRDNFSARGNVNPHTGAVGTRSPQN